MWLFLRRNQFLMSLTDEEEEDSALSARSIEV